MHKNTKITPILRKEVFEKWLTNEYSVRQLATQYHVDKKVIQRIIHRGKAGDFSVHDSINLKYKKNIPKGRNNELKQKSNK